MHINLPDSLSDFVEQQASARGFKNADEFVTDIIEAELRATREYYEAEVLKGISSGPSTPFTPGDWQAMRDAVLRRHAIRQESQSE
jgi:hypothetical protein